MQNNKLFRFLHSFVHNFKEKEKELLSKGELDKATQLAIQEESRPQAVKNMDAFLRGFATNDLFEEYHLIQVKKSVLPRTKRDIIVYYVDNVLKSNGL